MTRKRLAVVLPFITNEGGGVTEAVRVLVDGIASEDRYDIDVLSFEGQEENEARALWANVTFYSFPTYGPKSYRFSPGMILHMLKNRYDLIHLHGIWMSHALAARVAQIRGIPLLISPHGMLEPWILKRRATLKQAVSTLYQNSCLKRAATIHALTEKEALDIRAKYPKAKIEIVPNFVPHSDPVHGKPSWWTTQMDRRKTFLFLARIHDKKGWQGLLEAWRSLMTQEPHFSNTAQLVFCGWKDDVPGFESAVASASAAFGNVFYAGPQYGDDKRASYAVADVFVLPSFSEGLPMTVLEAAQSDTLVAMSKECNLPELLSDGMAVETGTQANEIQAALRRCLQMSDEEARSRRVKTCRFIEENMSEAAVVRRFEELYGSLMTGHRDAALPTTEEHSIFTGAPSFSFANRALRGIWSLVWLLCAFWTPPPLHKWRILLLKLFGAQIDWSCKIYGSARIWLPSNLSMGPHSVMGPRVTCYNQGSIIIEARAIISQGAHLCTGTHDFSNASFQLETRPISIGQQAWVCADAFVGPGVSIGEGAVLGARGVAFKDLPQWTVSGGNPAKFIKNRPVLPKE